MKNSRLFSCLLASGLLLASCGRGVDPIASAGDSDTTKALTLLSLPIPLTLITNGTISAGTSIVLNGFVTQPVLAPARGLISRLERTSNGFYAVTMIHDGLISSRVEGVSSPTFRVGDYVENGTQIGSVGFASTTFTVFLNNTAICSLSFLTSAARSQLFVGLGAINPCPS